MSSQDRERIFVVYKLNECDGIYDKTGYIVENNEETMIFETQSATYRICDEVLARKQRNGWHTIGTVQNIRQSRTSPYRLS